MCNYRVFKIHIDFYVSSRLDATVITEIILKDAVKLLRFSHDFINFLCGLKNSSIAKNL
jgi:hypothetical protein